MEVKELRAMFSRRKAERGKGLGQVSDIVDIGRHVRIFTRFDRGTLDSYLEVGLRELAASDIDEETLQQMCANGWTLSKDGMSIVKYP